MKNTITKTATFNVKGSEIEFSEIEFIAKGDTESQTGLLIHDTEDEFHDGDGIASAWMPQTAEEAEAIIENEWLESCFREEGGMYWLD